MISPLLVHLELTPDFTTFSCHDDGEEPFSGQYEGKSSDSVSVSVFDRMHVFLVSVSIWL